MQPLKNSKTSSSTETWSRISDSAVHSNSIESLCIQYTDLRFKNQISRYQGKVRDVYDIGDRLVMIATDRISAFDCVLPRPIPSKGQVLNQIARHFLEAVRDICPVWLLETPDPNVSIGLKCNPVPIEIVVRGYLAGHAWRCYKSGLRSLCGVSMPDGMKESQAFQVPLITPTTKASEGHDQDVSREEILGMGLIPEKDLDTIYQYAHSLYQRGSEMARDHGLILVDTKYEFGYYEGQIMLMDEVHTPDSSRYYLADSYEDNLNNNKAQTQLSKEFVREWLIAHGFQGLEGQMMPHMSDSFVWEISNRYIELYERITGKEFENFALPDIMIRLKENLRSYLD